MSIDAIVRALYRTFVSRRHLLEWTTAAAAQAAATTDLRVLVRKHWGAPLAAVVLWLALLASRHAVPVSAHAALPRLGRCRRCGPGGSAGRGRAQRGDALSADDRAYLHDVARDTWRLFERCVGAEDNHLPPDNLQIAPQRHGRAPHLADQHRPVPARAPRARSASAGSARVEMIERIEATLRDAGDAAAPPRPLPELVRHRSAAQALPPLYVSTVDSGNLCTHLLALAQACLALSRAPLDDDRRCGARSPLRRRGSRLLRARGQRAARRPARSPTLLAGADPLAERDRRRPGALRRRCSTPPPPSSRRCAADGVDELDADAGAPARLGASRTTSRPALGAARRDERRRRRDAARRGCSAIADDLPARSPREPDFGFLFNRKRRLFHIGFRVAEHQLDGGFYDLLASEARADQPAGRSPRATCPPRHWAALGRPFYAVGALAGLRSWSGSMFEYLMPTLVLDEPHGSVLHSAAHAAVREQIAFAREHHVPWGISESAYAAQRPHPRLPVRAARRAAPGAAPHADRRARDRAVRDRARRAGRAAPRRRQPAPARAGARARPLRLHRGARLLARRASRATEGVARVEHLHGAPPGHEHRRARQRAARRRAAPLGHGRCAHRGGGVAAARARAARGAAAARAAGEPDRRACSKRAPGHAARRRCRA